MSAHSNEEIATVWLKNCQDAIMHGSESSIADETFWAYRELDELCSSDPIRALDVVLKILGQGLEERIFYNLAAGPLEDLLTRNGVRVLNSVSDQAARDPRFRELLAGVWTEGMQPQVREQIAKIVASDHRPS